MRACTLGDPGDTWRSRTLKGGKVQDSVHFVLGAPPGRTRDVAGPLPQKEVNLDGRCRQNSNGSSAKLSCPALNVPQCCYSNRDGGAVTEVSGWDPGHIHCGNGGPTPP